jgi:hypothetical protein
MGILVKDLASWMTLERSWGSLGRDHLAFGAFSLGECIYGVTMYIYVNRYLYHYSYCAHFTLHPFFLGLSSYFQKNYTNGLTKKISLAPLIPNTILSISEHRDTI